MAMEVGLIGMGIFLFNSGFNCQIINQVDVDRVTGIRDEKWPGGLIVVGPKRAVVNTIKSRLAFVGSDGSKSLDCDLI